MLKIEKMNDTLVEIIATGKLSAEDYETVLPQLRPLLDKQTQIRFLIVLDDFKGWEFEALWKDLKFDQRYQNQLGKTAIVGENKLEKWGTQLSGFIYPSPIQFFEERQKALEWLNAE